MKMKWIAVMITSAGLLASSAMAEEKAPFKDQKAKESYSLGYQFGRNLTGQGIEIDKEILFNAIRDAMDGKQPVISEYVIKETVAEMRRRVLSQQAQLSKEQTAKNLEEAKAFLEENKKKEGVITLPSGLQYKVLREGKGAGPKATDGVRMRYRGMLVNGKEFDNVMDMPENDVPVIPVAGANQGWTEALQLMKPGAKWMLYVPPQLGFGDRPSGTISPNSVLIYELELLSVVDRSAAKNAAPAGHSGTSQKQKD
jgi:FKBP-type peptidyl-prolyl cis-trans isomerase FklB